MKKRWSDGGGRGAVDPRWEMGRLRNPGPGCGWFPLHPICWCLVFLGSLSCTAWAGVPCWEALLRCQSEPDCTGAYEQYQAACGPVLTLDAFMITSPPSATTTCPSHCIAALLHLNQTRVGPALEGCQCGRDVRCRRLQVAIEPCLPRTSASGGCMGARLRCEQEPACRRPLAAYLARCGQLFNGRRCTAGCRDTIEQLLSSAAGPPLQRCVCDGPERPFCEVLKAHMGRLCFGAAGELRPVRAGAEEEDGDYEEEDEDDDEGGGEEEGPRGESPQGGRGHARGMEPSAATHTLILSALLISWLSGTRMPMWGAPSNCLI